MNWEISGRLALLLRGASTQDRVFPATTLYNEGWMLCLVLDWLSRQPESLHPLSFEAGARWFSEGLLPSPFLARHRGDPLAEGWTHADGVVGHFDVGGDTRKADIKIHADATQLIIVEAKISSRLSSGVSNARYFDQAARGIACLSEMVRMTSSGLDQVDSLGFIVIAPRSQIGAGVFSEEMDKDSMQRKVQRRVAEYNDTGMYDWFEQSFLPVLGKATVEAISWEDTISHIGSANKSYGEDLEDFYNLCLRFNGRQGEASNGNG